MAGFRYSAGNTTARTRRTRSTPRPRARKTISSPSSKKPRVSPSSGKASGSFPPRVISRRLP
jgi:hypothetical protein